MNSVNPWRMTIDTNPDFCNLTCIMCEDHSPYSESRNSRKHRGVLRKNMSVELLEKVVREGAALGIKELIPSTMGEPLLYPHFELILDLCKELDLSLNLTTNGTFPGGDKNRNVEFWGQKITPITSDVKISWNGASKKTQELIMVDSNFDNQLDNVKRFIAVRDNTEKETGHHCNVTMQMTFLESNLAEIPAMVELAIELGFDRVKGHHLWAHFEEIKRQSLRKDKDSIERWNACVDKCHSLAEKYILPNGTKIKLDNFFKLDPENTGNIANDGECPFLGKELWVDPSGRFNVCCAPDQQRKTLGDFGNLTESTLTDLWQSDNYKQLQQNYMKNNLCKDCNMRKPT